MKDLYRLIGIEGNPSTAYHPQTDGQTERINQEIEQYLRIFINYHQSDWAEWLALAEFAYNDKEQSSTGSSPFMINNGRHPNRGTNPRREPRNESAGQFVERMKKIREEMASALTKAAETMKHFYDRTKGISIEYKPGDKVWLEGKNITTDRPMKKLGDKRHGPFTVIEKVGASAYKLKLYPSWKKVYPVFNEVLLSPFTEPAFPSQRHDPPPPPDIIDDIPEFEVEKILDSKVMRGKIKYLVHWKGYAVSERTWEPIENLGNSKDLVEEFHSSHPNRPKPLNINKIEVPINSFPTTLFRTMKPSVTMPTPSGLPSEELLHRIMMHRR